MTTEQVVRKGIAFEGDERMDVIGKLDEGDTLPDSPVSYFDPRKSLIIRANLAEVPGIKIIATVNALIPSNSETCKTQVEKLEEIAKENQEKFSVCVVTKEGPQPIASWAERERITHLQLFSADGPTDERLGAKMEGPGNWNRALFRRILVVDQNNKVVRVDEFFNQEEMPDLQPAVATAIELGASAIQ